MFQVMKYSLEKKIKEQVWAYLYAVILSCKKHLCTRIQTWNAVHDNLNGSLDILKLQELFSLISHTLYFTQFL